MPLAHCLPISHRPLPTPNIYLRQGVRYLHDISSRKGGPFWWIPYVLPLDKNIVFHKA